MSFFLAHIFKIITGIISAIGIGYVVLLNKKLGRRDKENVDLKESLSISRITKDIYKQQLQNKNKLDAEKETLKSRLNDVLGD
ncbi:MAG: hypothetical protein KBC72_00620 [Acinetobacter sp.]|nr:hypothetical protein [Acinetobacter sp.]